MLDDLRQHAAKILSATSCAILITSGPADLQAASVACEARGLRLYALVSRVSDVLFNLEQRPQVLVFTSQWQLRGTARILMPTERPIDLALIDMPEASWCVLIVITPWRLHWTGGSATDTAETIDLGLYAHHEKLQGGDD